MLLILRTLCDPALENLFLPRRQLLVRVGWRHQFVRIVRQDPFHQFALLRLLGHDGPSRYRFVAQIETQVRLAVLGVRAVTKEAVVGKDRPYVAIEFDGRRHG